MEISVEISMYPLDAAFEQVILDFIATLRQFEGLKIKTNSMSTQVFGPFDRVHEAIQSSMRHSFEKEEKVVMVMKYINAKLDYEFKNPE